MTAAGASGTARPLRGSRPSPRALSLTALVSLCAVACSRGTAKPSAVDARNDACAFCRMAVSDVRFAAQLAAPGEEPRFFDDVGCLARYLAEKRPLPRGTVAFVADHRTRGWIRAAEAIYTRRESLETPMGSHLIAHGNTASRDADPDAAGGGRVTPAELFGPAGPPDGKP